MTKINEHCNEQPILKNVSYLKTTSIYSEIPNDDLAEIVVIGKSNVGKSTFINFLTGQKKLAKTSFKPGKTKALSFFNVDHKFRLVDIPGYGYASVSKQQLLLFAKIIDEYFLKRKNIINVILLLDARRIINQSDIDMVNYLTLYQIPFVIIGTKVDKCTQSEIVKFKRDVKAKFNQPVIKYSYPKKIGFLAIKILFDNIIIDLEEKKK